MVKQNRDDMIVSNIPLVHSIANRFRGGGVEYDDLYQSGCVGLIKAAYFTLLSTIPFLLFFGALLKYTPVSLDFLVKGVDLVLPDYVSVFLVSIIRETYDSSVGLISLSAIFAIWSAARGIQYLTEGLNKMYDLEETRNWLVLRFWASIYTFIMIFSLILMLVLLVFGRTLQGWLVHYFHI